MDIFSFSGEPRLLAYNQHLHCAFLFVCCFQKLLQILDQILIAFLSRENLPNTIILSSPQIMIFY